MLANTLSRRSLFSILALILVLIFAACGQSADDDMDMEHGMDDMEHDMDMGGSSVETDSEVTQGDITIKDAWSRPALEGENGAGYMTIMNAGSQADTLTAVQSDAASAVELHEVTMNNDVMSMRPVEGGLEIPANGHVALEPGGYHIMLVGLAAKYEVGDTFSIMLTFENAGTVTVEVEVVQP